MTDFIIATRDMRTRQKSYYTGRAGNGWLSVNRADAFVYRTEGEAERKARIFMRQQRAPFWTDFADDADAHNAAAKAMSEEACGA